MVDALASYWGPVFSKTHSVPAVAKRYIDRFSSSEDFSEVRPPILRDVERALKQANWSAPGPDGLHYAAWRCGSGSRVLLEVLRWIALGNYMPSNFTALLA
eukprot:2736999-Pyramimonas_sp.AAC.1